MKILQVGAGDFGFSWLKDVLLNDDSIQIVGLVDKNKDVLQRAKDLCSFDESILFEDLRDALTKVNPDFILNITPPRFHKEVDFIALEFGIPVLSEKPIAECYDDAIEIYKKFAEKDIPIMISENYRYSNFARSAKKLLTEGEIGRLISVQIDFQRNHKIENYHKHLRYPLLIDVAIHHIDMLRYFTGTEGKSIFATSWTPSHSWYEGYSNLNFLLEMNNDIKVSYSGSLSSCVNETDWTGNWRFEGENGILKLSNEKLTLQKSDSEMEISAFQEIDTRKLVLEEFMLSLTERRIGETDISDNIKTFGIVWAAIESSQKNKPEIII